MKKKGWTITIIAIIAFAVLAPADAATVVHNLELFFHDIFSGIHLH